MPKIVGNGVTVVDHDGMTIQELAGHVATPETATVSIAHVVVDKATAEPWLTLAYDEWICCRRGVIELVYWKNAEDEAAAMFGELPEVLTLSAGETCFIAAGERFRPVFPDTAEYIAVCSPAFRPELCIREENATVSEVADKLRELHTNAGGKSSSSVAAAAAAAATATVSNNPSYTLYHMCQESRWDEAVQSGHAYFPPTFEHDGGFTHATAVAARLLDTANHFYTGTAGDWICVALSQTHLHQLGIVTRLEEPKAVGDLETDNKWNEWRCPHIFGGIPAHVPGVVQQTYPMKRDEHGNFLCIEGLTDSKS
jgi:uncharacterized protein (DUF952 family)